MSIRDVMKGESVVETLQSMGVMFLQLLVMVTIKAFVYVLLVKLYKYTKARFYPDEICKDAEKDKHLFDYESDWESEEEWQTVADKSKGVDTKTEPEKVDTADESKSPFIPDDELKIKADELVSNLRERKIYKEMTAAEFEKLKLCTPIPKTKTTSRTNTANENSSTKESKAHCKEA